MNLIRGLVVVALIGGSIGFSGAAGAVDISGSWRGSGHMQVEGGKRERVTCQISYGRQSERVYGFHAVCASPSVRVIQNGVVSQATASTFVGTAHNPEYNVSGRVRIVVSGNRQTVSVRADQGSGQISLSRR